jgi:alcohol dehydrogenase (cytochrome c)
LAGTVRVAEFGRLARWLPFAIAALLLPCSPLCGQVTYERLVNALREQQNWLTYFGDYSGIRHRDLKQINAANVKKLRVDWIFQTGQTGAFETVPLVVNGVMYITAGNGMAYALDARSGRQLWMYKHVFPAGRKASGVNRGFAILGDRLFMVTPDANVVALEASTGRLVWQTEMAPFNNGQHTATMAPLAVKDKIITGISGAEFGIRGFIDAYDARTGKRVWRFWTVPSKDEPGGDTWLGDSWQRGGGATWMTGTYDPALNMLYWGVGNPGPDLYGEDRRGDNLYTCSVVALDADSGKLKWHFQFSPHDTHDWDANETPMLLDLKWGGRDRKLLVQANRNAFFYVLDRQTGEFLLGKPFARQTWAKGLDDKGRPMPNGKIDPTPDGLRLCPGVAGAANWMAPSYNPETGLFYFPVREQCDTYYSSPPVYVEGKPFWGSVSRGFTDEREWGLLKALNPLTGETKWDFRYFRAPWAGTLSTSGGVVFAGDEDGYLMAFDARTGQNLWRINTGNRLATSPMTYMLDGRQYLTMPSGSALLTFALPE